MTTLVGRLEGAFNINGEGFGEKGALTISERQISTTGWQDNRIKGQLPKDLTSGKVTIKTFDASDKVTKEQTFMCVVTGPRVIEVATVAPPAAATK